MKKIIYGTLFGGIMGTLAGMVWFMGLFGAQGEQWMAENATCVNQMNELPYWAWILAILCMGLLSALTLDRLNINQPMPGAKIGTILFFLVFAIADLGMFVTFKPFQLSWVPIDIIGNTIAGAVGCAANGWLFGKLK